MRNPFVEFVTMESVKLHKSVKLKITNQHSGLQDVRDIVPWSRPTSGDGQPMASRTKHIPHCHIARVGNNHAVVLIPYLAILKEQINRIPNIESVSVMSCCKPFADIVWSIAERIIHDNILDGRVENPCYVDSVRWVILDIQISHD